MNKILEDKLNKLINQLKTMGKVAIAYSGGVDSNFLLKVAKDTLGDNILAITINAMMHSTREIEESNKYAKEFGVKQIVYKIDDLDLPQFIDNGPLRCYYCKKFIFTKIKEIASEHNIKYILDGTNFSDLDDYRPGLKALEELNIISPLKDAKLTKDEIRTLSKELNISTYNKAAFACLATRIPTNNKITKEKLRMIEEAENFLQDCGFTQYRVRFHEDLARIEVEKKQISKFYNDEIINMQNSYYNPESTVTVPTKYCHILDIFAKNICHNPSHSIAYKDAEIIVFDDVFADKFIYGAKTSIRSLVKEKYSLNRRKPSLAKCLELTHIDLPLYDCIEKAVALLEIYKSL